MNGDLLTALTDDVILEVGHRCTGGMKEVERACVEGLILDFVRFSDDPHPEISMQRIYIQKDIKWMPSGGYSIKPGNLRLNFGKLFEALVSGLGVYFTALANPLFAVLTALVTCRNLVKAAIVDIDENDAFVMWCAWICEQRGQSLTAENIREFANNEAKRVGYPGNLTTQQISAYLNRLEKIGAVSKSGNTWQTTETVIVKI